MAGCTLFSGCRFDFKFIAALEISTDVGGGLPARVSSSRARSAVGLEAQQRVVLAATRSTLAVVLLLSRGTGALAVDQHRACRAAVVHPPRPELPELAGVTLEASQQCAGDTHAAVQAGAVGQRQPGGEGQAHTVREGSRGPQASRPFGALDHCNGGEPTRQ